MDIEERRFQAFRTENAIQAASSPIVKGVRLTSGMQLAKGILQDGIGESPRPNMTPGPEVSDSKQVHLDLGHSNWAGRRNEA